MAAAGNQGQRTTLVAFLGLLAVVAWPVVELVRPYALTLLMAAILAVICGPIHRRLRTSRVGPRTSAALVTTGLLLLVIAPIGLFTWAALQQAAELPRALAGSALLDLDEQLAKLQRWGPARRLPLDPGQLEVQARAAVDRAGSAATSLVLTGIAEIPTILLHGALAAIGCYFFLADGRAFSGWLEGKLPLPPQVVEVLRQAFTRSAVATVLASMAAAAAQAGVTLAAFIALGLPAAFVAAGVAFVFAFVPVLGVTPVYLIGVTGLVLQGEPVRALLLFLAGCCAGVVDNIVRPAVLRGRRQLHPLASLVAIFGGIATFGLFGAFIGPVLLAVLVALIDAWPAVARHCGVAVSDSGSPPEIPLEPPSSPT
jgi:predicted PurR-regulated permease PerM